MLNKRTVICWLARFFLNNPSILRLFGDFHEELKQLYSGVERSTYLKPVNRWTTEEMAFEYTKKLYKQHNVIYHHRPFFLVSDIGGQMSYDIFIAGLNVAIEYQGKQYFEPVEFFGGEESFRRTVERDKLKKELSEAHGVKLVCINYWDNITPELIRERINNINNVSCQIG